MMVEPLFICLKKVRKAKSSSKEWLNINYIHDVDKTLEGINWLEVEVLIK
jgi:hypothetical protein